MKLSGKKSIKHLGVKLDRRLSFGEHLLIATAKAIQCGAALTRLMPNIGGPREAKKSFGVKCGKFEAALCSSGLEQCP